jgi:hypothetical protein
MMDEHQTETFLPKIPFKLPTNDILSFAGENFHYHVLGYSWSEGYPIIELLRLKEEGGVLVGTGEPEILDLRNLGHISIRFSGPPVCVGRHSDSGYLPCPGSISPDRFPQCMECMIQDIPDPGCIFEPHCHTFPCGADFCQVEHVVYITAFRDRMKVGMTQLRRMRTRSLEQGADAMLPLILLKDRFSARSFEAIIAQILGLPQMIPSNTKIPGFSRPLDHDEISTSLKKKKQELITLWDRVRDLSDPRAVLLEGPSEYDGDVLINDEIPLVEPLPSTPRRYKGERIRGDLVGFKGNYMIFRQGGLFAYRIGETPGKVVHSDSDILSRP